MIRRIGRCLLGGLVLSLMTVAILILSIDKEQVRDTLMHALSGAAGRPVELAGPLEMRWWPKLSLSVSEVRVRDPAFDIRAARVDVLVDTLAALSRRLEVERIVVVRPVVRLLGGAEDGPSSRPSVPDSATWPFSHFEVRGLELHGPDGNPVPVELITMDRDPENARVRLAVEAATIGKIAMNGWLSVSGSTWRLSELRAQVEDMALKGTLEADLSATTPLIRGELASERVVLGFTNSPGKENSLVPDRSIPLHWLTSLDLDLQLSVSRALVGDLSLVNVRLPLEVTRGALSMSARAGLAGGALAMSLEVDGDTRWRMRSRLTGADAGALLTTLGVPSISPGGRLHGKLSVSALGRTTTAVLHSLSGSVEARVQSLQFSVGPIDQFFGDMASGLVSTVAGGSDSTRLRCGVARFQISNGILQAHQSIGAQSDAANVLGGGTISLPANRMALEFRPWARGGLRIGAGALAGEFSVLGPVDAPRLEVGADSVLKGAASVGAAITTGGLSVLAQALLEYSKGDDPCGQALGQRIAGVSASHVSSAAQPAGRTKPASEADTSSLEKVGSLLGGLLPRGRGDAAFTTLQDRR